MPSPKACDIAAAYRALAERLYALGLPYQAAAALRSSETWLALAERDADGTAWLDAAIGSVIADARIDVYHAVLQQMQSQHGCFLVLKPVGGDFATAAIEDEVVGAISGFDRVQTLMDLAPQFYPVQIATQKRRAQRLAELDQRSVCGML